jgi:uncharacterized membrane protein
MTIAADYEDDADHAVSLGGIVAFGVGVLMLAAIVHIVAIFLVPVLAENDGFSRIARVAGEGSFSEVSLTPSGSAAMPGLDPLFLHGACSLRLADGPVAIGVQESERYWSLALYDRHGTVIFSLNDRTATDGRLDMLIVNPVQAAQLKAEAGSLGETVVVESPSDDLIALARFYAPVRSVTGEAREALQKATCEPVTLGGPDPEQSDATAEPSV